MIMHTAATATLLVLDCPNRTLTQQPTHKQFGPSLPNTPQVKKIILSGTQISINVLDADRVI
jgi:hypothetical protein